MLRALTMLCALVIAVSAAWGADYAALVAAAKKGDAPVDWQALRFAYADSPGFDAFGTRTMRVRKAMSAAFQRGDFAEAAAQGEQLLDAAYLDIDAHAVCAAAYEKLGDAVRAKRHRDAVAGLLASIRTGDGSSPATAFTVITVAEEYSVMRQLGLKTTGQALVQSGGHAYDKLDAVDKQGQAHSYFFLIDRVVQAESNALKPKP
jgi:hypothetical protein